MSDDKIVELTPRRPIWYEMRHAEDWWAIWVAAIVLVIAWFTVEVTPAAPSAGQPEVQVHSLLKNRFAKPGGWESNPGDAFLSKDRWLVGPIAASGAVLLMLFTLGTTAMGQSAARFLQAFPPVFVLAIGAYVLAGQSVIKYYNLEYALWALLLGLLISNTVGTPAWLRPAVRTEFYIKTGLVLFGAEVLLSRLLALGVPGVFVAWVVTPIVLISTYIFGQKVLKMESKSLNMVICADMSVCGVSAAIATAAACRAKKEELSLAIALSLVFTVAMMIVMPWVIRTVGIDEVVGGAWMGGTIDSTGAVAAAGALLGQTALTVATTVKMIQNILIGATAFGVAIYWVTCVDRAAGGARPDAWEIWYRFPKFVLGFLAMSAVFSWIWASSPEGTAHVDAVVNDVSRTLRDWCFCLAFVSIGLESRVENYLPQLRSGKPLVLYVCGQSLNLILTLLMAWLMFGVVFREWIARQLQAG